MKKLFDFFHLSQKEQRGLFLLIVLLTILLIINIVFPLFYKESDIRYSISNYKADIDSNQFGELNERRSFKKTVTKQKLFRFDPNTLEKDGWMKLGLSDKQAQVILNYRSKGGKFYKKEDLHKIYSLTEKKLNELLPFVDIPETKLEESKSNYTSKWERKVEPKEAIILDVNRADSLDFMKLRGIGPAYARRIIKFRESLGGFVKREQIAEVYGLPEETYLQILPFLTINIDSVKNLKINVLSVSELSKHPYINYKQAKTIVNFRNQHGAYKSISDLREIHSLDEEFLRKIEFYLDFTQD